MRSFLGMDITSRHLVITLVSEELNTVVIMTHQAEADTDNLSISAAHEYAQSHVDPGVNNVFYKDGDVLDSMPLGDEITLIGPQPCGLEPKYIDIESI